MLTIRGIGIREKMPPSLIQRPRGTGDYLFMMFPQSTRAGGRPEDLDATIPARSNFCVLWTKGAPQFYGNQSEAYCHSWIHFDGNCVRKLIKKTQIPVNTALPLTAPDQLDRHIRWLYEEATRPGVSDPEVARLRIRLLFLEAVRDCSEASAPMRQRIPSKLTATRLLMETQSATRWKLPELAAQAGMSVSHFQAQFRTHFGTPPMHFLLRMRLQNAARLLRDSGLRISEISLQCGYEDLYQFSKIFRKHFGSCPRSWRNAQKQTIR